MNNDESHDERLPNDESHNDELCNDESHNDELCNDESHNDQSHNDELCNDESQMYESQNEELPLNKSAINESQSSDYSNNTLTKSELNLNCFKKNKKHNNCSIKSSTISQKENDFIKSKLHPNNNQFLTTTFDNNLSHFSTKTELSEDVNKSDSKSKSIIGNLNKDFDEKLKKTFEERRRMEEQFRMTEEVLL